MPKREDHPEVSPDILRITRQMAELAKVQWDLDSTVPKAQEHIANLKIVEAINRMGSSEPHDSKLDDTMDTWRHLRLGEMIGEGTHGEVYRAHDSQLQMDVALKLFKPAEYDPGKERFLSEARRLAKLVHPNIVRVHGADKDKDRVGIWMEFVEGDTLEDLVRQRGSMGAKEAALIGVEICSALAALHSNNLVHGDVKTKNVMRRASDGHIILMDFGSVREPNCSQTENAYDGTPISTAPEVYLKGQPPSVASDLYSLGVVLYRLVSGRYPVDAKNTKELKRKLEAKQTVPLRDRCPHLPSDFVDIVERALSYRAEERFRTVGAMELALMRTLKGTTSRGQRRKRVAFALLLAAMVISVVLGMRFNRSLRVETALYRLGADEPLIDNAILTPGDSLYLALETNAKIYLYVINEATSELGKVNVLFPVDGLDLGNPLSSDRAVEIPGQSGGARQFWPVTRAGGEETILFVASRQPVLPLERYLKPEEPRRASGNLRDGPRGIEFSIPAVDGLSKVAAIRSELAEMDHDAVWIKEMKLRSLSARQ